MSFKASLVKTAIKWTPNKVITWVANIILKNIATLTDFNLDFDARKVYVQTLLNGEAESIEVWIDGFAVVSEGDSYRFVIDEAQSNKPWLSNAMAHIVGKEWKIPVIPKYKAYIELIAEVLRAETPTSQEADQDEVV